MVTKTKFNIRYLDTIGFNADQGGRGFHLPTDMVIRDDGVIFVVSRSNTVALNIVGIQMVKIDHDYLGQIGGYGRDMGDMIGPTALALDADDNLYLADEVLQRVTVYSRDGDPRSTWGTVGDGDGEFDAPSGIVFDSDDNMLLVDHKNHRIQRFTKDGKFIEKWGSFGDGPGEFNLPWGIALDPDGNVCVADWRNDRIQRFTADGEFLAAYGSSGDGDGEFNRPSRVGIDSGGNMYVADWGNQRVQVLDSDGNFLVELKGEATLSKWSAEYLDAQQDEFRARSTFEPYFDVDTDDKNEIAARIEPYFWDPVSVVVDKEDRSYVLETCRHRFQIYERVA